MQRLSEKAMKLIMNQIILQSHVTISIFMDYFCYLLWCDFCGFGVVGIVRRANLSSLPKLFPEHKKSEIFEHLRSFGAANSHTKGWKFSKSVFFVWHWLQLLGNFWIIPAKKNCLIFFDYLNTWYFPFMKFGLDYNCFMFCGLFKPIRIFLHFFFSLIFSFFEF